MFKIPPDLWPWQAAAAAPAKGEPRGPSTHRVLACAALVAAVLAALLTLPTVATAAAWQVSSSTTGATGATGPAAPAPPNDNRDAAQPLGSLPASATGTTVGATVEGGEPSSQCDGITGSVWYSFTTGATVPNRIGIQLLANGDFDAVVDVFLNESSQNVPIACGLTNVLGFAGVTFNPVPNSTYLIRVAQLWDSVAGTFSLGVFGLPAAAAPPGTPLNPNGSAGELDSTFNTTAAYSVRLRAGRTYKVNLVTHQHDSLSLGLYPPGTTQFAGGRVALICTGYSLFTPRTSGLWSFLVSADPAYRFPQHYVLHVAPATRGPRRQDPVHTLSC